MTWGRSWTTDASELSDQRRRSSTSRWCSDHALITARVAGDIEIDLPQAQTRAWRRELRVSVTWAWTGGSRSGITSTADLAAALRSAYAPGTGALVVVQADRDAGRCGTMAVVGQRAPTDRVHLLLLRAGGNEVRSSFRTNSGDLAEERSATG
jgi:hypothetical protein